MRPTVGNQPSFTAKTYLRMIARKKIGIEIPSSETTRLAWSIADPCFFAARKPSGIPIKIEKNIAARASSIVAGNFCFSSSTTGCRVAMLSPRSPLTTVPR